MLNDMVFGGMSVGGFLLLNKTRTGNWSGKKNTWKKRRKRRRKQKKRRRRKWRKGISRSWRPLCYYSNNDSLVSLGQGSVFPPLLLARHLIDSHATFLLITGVAWIPAFYFPPLSQCFHNYATAAKSTLAVTPNIWVPREIPPWLRSMPTFTPTTPWRQPSSADTCTELSRSGTEPWPCTMELQSTECRNLALMPYNHPIPTYIPHSGKTQLFCPKIQFWWNLLEFEFFCAKNEKIRNLIFWTKSCILAQCAYLVVLTFFLREYSKQSLKK